MHSVVLNTRAVVQTAPRAAAPRRARCAVVACAAPRPADAALPRRAALQRAALLALPLALPALARAADSPAGDTPFVAGPSGMQYADTVVGTGAEPEKGRLVKVGYVGTLTANGKKFDAARIFAFGAGNGEVIRGWDLALLGEGSMPPMRVGGTRVVRLPPALAYGARGAGCKAGECIIPPDSSLDFVIELKSVQ